MIQYTNSSWNYRSLSTKSLQIGIYSFLWGKTFKSVVETILVSNLVIERVYLLVNVCFSKERIKFLIWYVELTKTKEIYRFLVHDKF